MFAVDQNKTRIGVVYDCVSKCGEGGGRDFMMPVSADIPARLEEACPACGGAGLALNVGASWQHYQTELTPTPTHLARAGAAGEGMKTVTQETTQARVERTQARKRQRQ